MTLSPEELDSLAISNFRQYLRIPSVHPNVNYEPCVHFLEKQATSIGLRFTVFRDVPKNPMVILTWTGKDSSLPTIMLNSHMDVVPVFEDKWTHRPFDADIDENGDIYARGAQDIKCLGIWYLEAIRRLKQNGVEPRRTVHVTFTPDEELGGGNGMQKYLKTKNFKDLNVGFALDESIGGEDKRLFVFYGEKRGWKFSIHCPGQAGHSSFLLENTAGEKVRYILDKVYDFRAEEKVKEKEEGGSDHITTINLTMLRGGVQDNVIPEEFVLIFDTRIPPDDFDKFSVSVNQWCKSAGKDVWIEDLLKDEYSPSTQTDDSNIFLAAFKKGVEEIGYRVELKILPANTDARFLRAVNIPTLGFAPRQNTPRRSHGDDEFLNVNVFLQGIKIYMAVISGISNA